MDANRLEEWKQKVNEAKSNLIISPYQSLDLIEYVHDMHNCIVYISQQQAEIERLNRAYEVLEKAAFYYSEAERFEPRYIGGFSEMEGDAGALARSAIAEGKRIKNGNDEPQQCVDCQTRNAVNDQLCDECYQEWENEGTLE